MENRIREMRARLNLSQQELAGRVGVRRETIVFLEKGKYNPSLRLAYDLARLFNISIEALFFPEESEKGQ
jgi:putative transcriptional regulator